MLLFHHMFPANMASNFKLPQFQIALLPLKSPCLWEHISIAMQLAFLVLLLLQFVRRLVSLLCRRRTEDRDEGVEKFISGVKFNISYRISMVCSTLLFGTHSVMLLIMLNGGETLCDSEVKALSSELMQVVLWASTMLAIYNIPSKKHVKFPWNLRAWWFCSFLLSIISTALDTYSRVKNHSQFRVRDYGDFICLLPSTLLLAISIQGKTGLVYTHSNDSTEPLLNGKTERRHLAHKRESPYGKATLLQLVTFSWLNPLFAVGIKKPLEKDEIPEVDIKDSAEFLSHKFDQKLTHVKQKEGSTNPSIYKAIFLFIRKKAAINACFAVISAASSYVGPYLIQDFVNFLNEKNKQSLMSGYLLALAFLGAKMVETIGQRQWIFGARQLGLRLRVALISQIYRKGLRLSCQSRQSHASGEILNLMSVDIQRITDFIWYLNYLWMLPVQISLAIYVLHTNLGLGSLVALAATLIVMSCNIPPQAREFEENRT